MSQTSIHSLLAIMQQLRDPQSGCPWDIQQSFKSIAAYTIEEAYEVADAIERNALDELKDELGDLLLQVVFHSQIAKEQGHFEFTDVVQAICEKMTRRHPHVFSDVTVKDAKEQTKLWDSIKAEERLAKQLTKQLGMQGSNEWTNQGLSNEFESILQDVPKNLPSLLRAKKLTARAAGVGFDWPDAVSVLQKLDEESNELKEAIALNNPDAIEEELGDLLFVLANLSRHLNINPDKALRRTNQKFINRFISIEEILAKQGKPIEDCSLEELDSLWERVKSAEKRA